MSRPGLMVCMPPADASAAARDLAYQAFTRYGRALFAFIRHRVRNDDLAQDLVQDVFMKLLLTRSPVSDPEKLSAWLYRVAHNVITDHFRKHQERAATTDIAAEEAEASWLERYEQCLPAMMGQLEAKYRDALRIAMKGRGAQLDVAKQLGLSYSGARVRVQRARRLLEQTFRKHCNITTDSYGNVIDDHCADGCGCGEDMTCTQNP